MQGRRLFPGQGVRRGNVSQPAAFLNQCGFAAAGVAHHQVPGALVEIIPGPQMALQPGFPVMEITVLTGDVGQHRIDGFQFHFQPEFFKLAQAAPDFYPDNAQGQQEEDDRRQPAGRQGFQRAGLFELPVGTPPPQPDKGDTGQEGQYQRGGGFQWRQTRPRRFFDIF
ncbi:hypothetical protein Phpb_02345 [Photorhabdus namnaonensis]|uniref:Uncharacterized protein n=1 Tax=Photorhabdus namnaonensis TaxID=1851568 RepID=A0A1B8YHH5_9GAMM|nr:hypothetical protein Phpb_02345 [Photorhabdus namnaonensis]